jgi:alpha-ketoglutarate-dependent 2,4-dichlorophenoxyacetate dioxygenase
MTLQIRPLHPLFVGEASGVDIRQPLTRAAVDAINDGMNRYGVLVFPGQPLDQDQQVRFAEQFGSLDTGLTKVTKAKHRFKHAALLDISNVAPDGALAPRGHKKLASGFANQLWHSDSSFQRVPGQYSMLSAVILPEEGGETEFADVRAAYDALPDRMKARCEGLIAEHWALHSRIWLGDEDWTEEQKRVLPPVYWPLVRTHAGSGRKSLFIGAHCREVIGWPTPEARMFLLDLQEHATQRQFVYSHTWRVGDLVIWDNRCMLHRGRPYDLGARRELRRTTIEDLASEAIERATAAKARDMRAVA